MTTKNSPLSALKSQADRIAKVIKQVERGENPIEDRGGKIASARGRESVKVGVVMDDKVLTIDLAWAKIRETSEVAMAAWILDLMRERRETQN